MMGRIALGVGIIACVAATASPSHAAVVWDLKPSGTGDWDWSLRLTGVQYASGVSYAFKGLNWTYAAGHCFELSTSAGRFDSNPDTRIFAEKEDGTWISINDDWNGTLQSKVRVWTSYVHANDWEGYTFMEVRPYTAGTGFDFGFTVTRRDLSETACTSGAAGALPWVKFKGTGFQQYNLTWGNAS